MVVVATFAHAGAANAGLVRRTHLVINTAVDANPIAARCAKRTIVAGETTGDALFIFANATARTRIAIVTLDALFARTVQANLANVTIRRGLATTSGALTIRTGPSDWAFGFGLTGGLLVADPLNAQHTRRAIAIE